MSTMTPCPPDHPLMIAWNKYKSSEEYENAKKWATNEKHTEGSLWAAFMAGFNDQTQAREKAEAELAEARKAAWEAARLMSESAAEAGRLKGEMEGIGWNGGVAATVDAFRAENERLRAELAELKKPKPAGNFMWTFIDDEDLLEHVEFLFRTYAFEDDRNLTADGYKMKLALRNAARLDEPKPAEQKHAGEAWINTLVRARHMLLSCPFEGAAEVAEQIESYLEKPTPPPAKGTTR